MGYVGYSKVMPKIQSMNYSTSTRISLNSNTYIHRVVTELPTYNRCVFDVPVIATNTSPLAVPIYFYITIYVWVSISESYWGCETKIENKSPTGVIDDYNRGKIFVVTGTKCRHENDISQKKQEILSKRSKTSQKGRKMHKFWAKK